MTKTEQKWKVPKKVASNKLPVTGYPNWFLNILAARGLTKAEQIEDYLNPKYENIVKPENFQNIAEAVDRIKAAKEADEKLMVYGDYDVDGITATAVVMETLNKIGVQNVENYIPHREDEGYGLNAEALAEIKKNGATLVIAVDCGITSGALIDAQKELDFIVIDHHTIKDGELPKRAILLHPSLTTAMLGSDPSREEYGLSAAGMAFIFALALQEAFPKDFLPGQEKWLLDLVALSTICDIMTLQETNRLLAYFGLIVLKKTKREGLKALMDVSGVDSGGADAYSAGFLLGPRLNAAGRLESAQKALNLLLTKDKGEARQIAVELNKLNSERQLLCQRIVEEARIKAEENGKESSIQVLSDKNWPRGVVGIVASRITDQYNRPTIIFEDDGELHHGSARSVDSVNITELLSQTSDYLVKFGGHAKAAGLTVSHEHFVVFKEKLLALADKKIKEVDLTRELSIDAEIKLNEITDEAMSLLSKMEPTGFGNKRPVLMMTGVNFSDIKRVGKTKEHLKFKIQSPVTSNKSLPLEAVAFSESREVHRDYPYDVVFTLKYNVWNNRKTIEARVIDFRESGNQ